MQSLFCSYCIKIKPTDTCINKRAVLDYCLLVAETVYFGWFCSRIGLVVLSMVFIFTFSEVWAYTHANMKTVVTDCIYFPLEGTPRQ